MSSSFSDCRSVPVSYHPFACPIVSQSVSRKPSLHKRLLKKYHHPVFLRPDLFDLFILLKQLSISDVVDRDIFAKYLTINFINEEGLT